MGEETGYVAYVGYDGTVHVEEVTYIRQPARIRILSNKEAFSFKTYISVDDPRIKSTPELAGDYLRKQLARKLVGLEQERKEVTRCYRQVGAAVKSVRTVINRAGELRGEALKGKV